MCAAWYFFEKGGGRERRLCAATRWNKLDIVVAIRNVTSVAATRPRGATLARGQQGAAGGARTLKKKRPRRHAAPLRRWAREQLDGQDAFANKE